MIDGKNNKVLKNYGYKNKNYSNLNNKLLDVHIPHKSILFLNKL